MFDQYQSFLNELESSESWILALDISANIGFYAFQSDEVHGQNRKDNNNFQFESDRHIC